MSGQRLILCIGAMNPQPIRIHRQSEGAMIMSNAIFNSPPATAEINRGAIDQDKPKDNRDVLPKSPKVQQILRDYWTSENDRRKARPHARQ